MANYASPGVYIEEKNAFTNSAVAIETAIPAFIGYTFKAERNGKSLIRIPTRINSFAEYLESFGGAFRPKFKVETANAPVPVQSFKLGSRDMTVTYEENNELYFFNSIRLFYANGGGPCVILSVGVYGGANAQEVKASDFMANTDNPDGPLEILKNEQEPTLIVMPDIAALGTGAYMLYKNVLSHCAEMQSRFGLFDLKNHDTTEKPDDVVKEFRTEIGTNFLNYGAAYYPWLNTGIVDTDELTFENLPANLQTLLEVEVEDIFKNYQTNFDKLTAEAEELNPNQLPKTEKELTDDKKKADEAKKIGTEDEKKDIKEQKSQPGPIVIKETYEDKKNHIFNLNKNHHLALKSSSPYYRTILNQARNLFNELPPSAAMAGLYTMVDNTRGVWKAPANYSLNSVNSPIVNISSKAQEQFNIDPYTGKSINVIRPFQGLGTLVWGARTLDGNSQDWKYINVRRTLIMIEQSIKAAARDYVFEPNNTNTWITVKAMISSFLTNLWKQGALAGAVPEQAFEVQIGLGSTMTPTDILEGKMLIMIKLAVVRPAEFIIISFQQQLQQS